MPEKHWYHGVFRLPPFSQIRGFPKVLCSGARSLSLKRAKSLSLDTVQFYTLYLLTPSPSPRTPHPHPGGIQGLLRGRYDHGADPGEIPKTEHCRAASCADIVATSFHPITIPHPSVLPPRNRRNIRASERFSVVLERTRIGTLEQTPLQESLPFPRRK